VDTDDDAERLIHSLSMRGYEIVTVIEQTKTNRLATARLRVRAEHTVLIDLLRVIRQRAADVAAAPSCAGVRLECARDSGVMPVRRNGLGSWCFAAGTKPAPGRETCQFLRRLSSRSRCRSA
jgi:hypothetical protein